MIATRNISKSYVDPNSSATATEGHGIHLAIEIFVSTPKIHVNLIRYETFTGCNSGVVLKLRAICRISHIVRLAPGKYR